MIWSFALFRHIRLFLNASVQRARAIAERFRLRIHVSFDDLVGLSDDGGVSGTFIYQIKS